MINEFNINIFNYIFSINEDIKAGIKKEQQEYKQELNKIINEICGICGLQDFWNEHKDYFNDGCVFLIPGTSGVKYDNFPRMKLDTKNMFFDFKVKQIEKIIKNNGDLIQEELEKVFVNIENLGRKVILDYCENKGLIQYNGKVFIAADDYPAYDIIYDNIKAVICNNEEISPTVIQNIFKGNNYGILNQANNFQNNDEKLFEIILKKLDAMQVESNLPTKKTDEIREACNKKEKSKVIKFLREIAMGTGTNLIASGILEIFGLM